MDGRANVGNDNISRQKVGLEALMLDASRAAVTPISAMTSKSKKAGIAPTFPFASTSRQYIRGRGRERIASNRQANGKRNLNARVVQAR
ncbi:hypothetical protein NKJ26_26790 [Mesorhizobium sp. M0152]|uniref:hypothetical protein n=1 Tax=unclassified Mesorhizobium TaxID=325217 RepID=UPI0033399D1D